MQCSSRKKPEQKDAAYWMQGPSIEPLQLAGNEHIADLIDQVYAKSGFNARRLAQACRLYARMLNESTTVGLTLAGAMTPIGMSGVIISLIEAGFVDLMISTGANIYHDLHRPYDCPMVQGQADIDDNALADVGIARIYDVFIEDEDTLMATDRCILDALGNLDYSKPFSTADLHFALGEAVAKSAPHPEKSMVAVAAKHNVPIYTSSPGDSSIGMNLIVPHFLDQPVNLNPIIDVIETAAIVRAAEKNGAVMVGGGSPKNFYLQTQPTLHQILRDPSKRGHDYFIQLAVDSPHWGGLSGATPQEARSWGKIKDAQRDNIVVYSCASLTFPLLAQYVLVRNQPRPQKKLYSKIGNMVGELLDSARSNSVFLDEYSSYYGPTSRR